jgi:hypothetical protein
MSGQPRATCPVCESVVRIFYWHGALIYDCHGPDLHAGDSCEASAWLVEDDEIIQAPKKADGRRRLKPINHGSPFGRDAHKRRGEAPCEACIEADRAYQRDAQRRLYARRKSKRELTLVPSPQSPEKKQR